MRYSKQRELVMQTVQNLCDHPAYLSPICA